MDTLFVVMPAYNEEENIEEVVRQWYSILEDKGENSRLVIADNGSTDSTHKILMGMKGDKFPKLEILTESDKGHGPKVIALYDYAIKCGADYIFQTDSDGQTNPDEFNRFWMSQHKYEAVIGFRKKRGDGIGRAFVEKVVCVLLFIYFGVKVPDARIIQKFRF